MKGTTLDVKSQHMLELLAEGASARVIARKLGYSEGTTRVYLHNLYKTIGVGNKTQAVIWYLNRTRPAEATFASAPMSAPASAPAAPPLASTVGEMALAEDLYTALGAMGGFLGPYGHMWETGQRLKGSRVDEKAMARRAQARLLWRALLKGDFAYGKMLYDDGTAERLAVDAPSDAVLAACLLSAGGYSTAAHRLSSQLGDRRKGTVAITAREAALLRAVREVSERDGAGSVAPLNELTADGSRTPLVRQAAMALLFHAYRARKEIERAQRGAEALWAEAESVRQQLDAMGVRPLTREATQARAGKSARELAAMREKAAVTR
jgi:DNA-binding CsgD family transcriptional regulator